ncbi:10252_t:CDS:2, partial [Racocetra persica]
ENLEIGFSVIVDLEENLIENIMDSSSISKESFDKLKNILLIPIIRDDIKKKYPQNHLTRRNSEARQPIQRFSCAGTISIKVNLINKKAIIYIKHLLAHLEPTHHLTSFPNEAKRWIQSNINY